MLIVALYTKYFWVYQTAFEFSNIFSLWFFVSFGIKWDCDAQTLFWNVFCFYLLLYVCLLFFSACLCTRVFTIFRCYLYLFFLHRHSHSKPVLADVEAETKRKTPKCRQKKMCVWQFALYIFLVFTNEMSMRSIFSL